ncbi:MAG: PDZ domain-containing protein [Candidatus Omnitrophica bacterium]|nr:PDZ domain-containing protein [Candidatus Omnitrophota bacterium]
MANDIDRQLMQLERKKRAIKMWTIALGVVALIGVFSFGSILVDHFIKGTVDGQLEINTKKVDAAIAFIGAEIREIDRIISEALGLDSTDGVLVNDVVDDSPASKAGLERGDVILAVNGTTITNTLQIQEELLSYSPGDKLKLLVDKADGGKDIIYLIVGSKPDDTGSSDTDIVKTAGTTDDTVAVAPTLATTWGISVSPLTTEAREKFNLPDEVQGVVVVAVAKGSLADNQGIKVGDVIESINTTPVPNLQTFYAALNENEGVLLDIYSATLKKNYYVSLPDEGDYPPQVVLMNFTEEVKSTGKIAIPSDTPYMTGMVFSRFATSPYFILYDLNTNEAKAIKNPYADVIRGMSITVADMVIKQDIDAIIVSAIGPQAFDAFYLAKVKVYGPFNGTVAQAVKNYQLNKLEEMKEANLGGYGYSSTAVIPSSNSPMTTDTDDESDGGLEGAPTTIPPMGKPADLELTAGSDPRVSRSDLCVCPNCGTQVYHPAGTACSDMVCPVCGSRLMNMDPGSEDSGPADVLGQVPAPDNPVVKVALSGTFVSNAPTNPVQPTSNLWTISNQPTDVGPSSIQQTAGTSTTTSTSTTQVTTCVCPLDGTIVIHPVGVPCAALQCPVCGSRMVSGTNTATTDTLAVQRTAGITVSNAPATTGAQQVFFVPIAGGGTPANVVPTSNAPATTGAQQVFFIPVAGGPPADMGGGSGDTTTTDTSPSDSAGPAVDGQSQGGGQASSSSAAQTGRSTECICPMCSTIVTHPIGVPCASLTCPVCGSRLVNAEPGGAQDDVSTVPASPQTAYIPVAGAPPTDMGPSSDTGSSDSTGSSDTQAQSGRSTECICPMCSTIVTHPIGVPCAALTCPVCGSRLVNALPGGTAGTNADDAAVLPMPSGQIVQVATSIARSIVVPSNGRTLTSEVAQLLDSAQYFIFFSLGKYEVVRNPYYRDSRASGAEIAQFIVGEGGAIVICNNISVNAAKAFKALQVKVYDGFTGTIQQALDIYSDGRLKDTGTVTGVVSTAEEEEHEGGGGGPPATKSKSKGEDGELM